MNGAIDRPHKVAAGFPALLFGAGAAPVFWLGQLMLGYLVTAEGCYPGDHPVAAASAAGLKATLIGFDAVAALAAAAGAVVAGWCLMRLRKDESPQPGTAQGRARFLALWGLLSSLWFFSAILFNAIASLLVTPCPG